jgi:hypothetical protein
MKVACTMNVAAMLRQQSTKGRGNRSVAACASEASSRRNNATASLRQNIFYDMPGDVGQTEVSPLIAVSESLMINSK